jgi:hypothetical protein
MPKAKRNRIGMLSVAWLLLNNDRGEIRSHTPEEAERLKSQRDAKAKIRKERIDAMKRERERQKERD